MLFRSYALAQLGGNITALEINQEINLFGSHVNLVGTTFDTYPPIQDAPVEKKIEKEEGSWLGNLVTGIVVTAAFAGLAIATVATGGAALAAVALAGAAVGTGVVTGAVAYADAKSGHARTWTQFLGNLAMGGAIGATTAASIYGLWTVLPAASQAAGLQVSLWTETTSSMTVSTIPAIATYGGYGLMGANGAFALNEITSIGTGQNWMLDHVFGGNQEAYDGAYCVSMMITQGYMQVGADNYGLERNNSGEKLSNQDQLEENKKQGRKFEQENFAEFSKEVDNAEEQITIKTNTGTKFRADAVGLDKQDASKVVIQEYKSSPTATLTKNQKKGFPELQSGGGIVVGKGKGIFNGGYPIPAGTEVQIIRPLQQAQINQAQLLLDMVEKNNQFNWASHVSREDN